MENKTISSEHKCNRCDFVTHSLRTLYRHKRTCLSRISRSLLRCGYCKRKFTFPFLLRQHLKTCVKRNKKKKVSQLRSKRKNNKLTNGCGLNKKSVKESKSSTIVCPICMKFFNSRSLYATHEKSGTCGSKVQVKKKSASARKSLQKTPSRSKKNQYRSESSDSDSSLVSDSLLSDIVERNRKFGKYGRGYSCIRCKKSYPAKVFLLKHLDTNYKCALAHFERDFFQKKFTKARKSVHQVVARKSFSNSYRNSYKLNKSKSSKFEASARKSLPNSFPKQQFKHDIHSNSIKATNQCPACHERFSDSFDLHQHQKKYQHWGKATKTINLSCKCPFCFKEFFSVRARNAHVRNHADQTDKKIEAFLTSTTCDICSQVFMSEALKLQHLKIEHSNRQNSKILLDSTGLLTNDGHISLPLTLKQQLKQYPNDCPICSERFMSSKLRNNHFEDIHLNSAVACQFCAIKCSNEELIDDHMKKFHYDQFKYECFVCKDKFPSVAHVVTHVKKLHPAHDPKNKQQSAVKTFSRIPETARLELLQESQEKDQGYFCDICNLTFPKLQFLRRHEQSKQHCDTLVKNLDAVHESLSNLPPSPPPALPKTVATPENVTCSECFEEFTTLKDFVPHRLSHFGEKEKYMQINEDNTYTCEICGDISDSHSKVQIHLFWHLQIQSSAKEKKIFGVPKSSPALNKSNNQGVAKKSFGKQTRETQQEVIIGGVKQSLFVCDSCKIGFTDQTHYNLHVRRFCRMKNNPLSNKPKEAVITQPPKQSQPPQQSSSAFINSNFKKSDNFEIVSVEIALCYLCCSVFNKSIKPVHDEFCSKCKRSRLEPSSNVIGFKTSIKLRKAVAACLKCDCLFLTSQKFSEHMLSLHGLPKEREIPVDNQTENVLNVEAEIPLNTEKEIPLNRAEEISLNEGKEIPVNKEKEILVNEEKEILVNKEKEILVNKEKEILANKEKEVLASEEKEVSANKEAEILANEESEILINQETKILASEEKEIPMSEENGILVSKENESLVNEKKEEPINENEILMNEENFITMNENNEISINDENTLVLGGDFVIHCTTCNFIFFSTDVLSEHEKTCTKFAYSNSRLENYTPEFKAALEENAIISSCLNCDFAFNSPQDLTEHLELHLKESAEQDGAEVMVLDESSVQDEKMDTAQGVFDNTSVPATSHDISSMLPNTQMGSVVNNKDVPAGTLSNSLPNKKIDDIESLRKNFSQLLSILVSDPDLMQQLGYGELLVDEVLVNVLQTMEQKPVLKDERTSEIECLRKNIQILLDFCLEDQIMALIGDGKTSTDDIVVEALKIFGGESSMSLVAME